MIWLRKNTLIIIILAFIGANASFFGILSDNEVPSYVWSVVVWTELLFIYLFVYTTVIVPIWNLKKEIASFLTWWKKWKQIELKSSNPTMQYIIGFFNKSLEILKNFKDELRSWKELKSEVQLAAEIQKNTLSKNFPKIPSINIVANSKSATEVWGDSYEVIQQNDNFYIYLWDVTWHWVASGFVMMMVNALISWFSKTFINSAEVIANTNEILKPRVPSNMLMTLLMVRWNENEKKMYMTWAWHEYLLIYKKSEWKAFKVKSWWVALWMTKNISKIVKESQIWIDVWDIVVLYTDWITEARNTNKEDWLMFWIDKLTWAIENSPFKTAQWVFNNITIELSKWMWYWHRQFDDITLVVMHYKWNIEITEDANPVIPEANITEWSWTK